MEATMKKKLDTDEDDVTDRLEKRKKKTQSDFMKQLTDLAQQVVERPPSQPEPVVDEIKRQVNLILFAFISILFFLKEIGEPSSSSRAPSRLARQTPLRRPPTSKSAAPSKPARIPVKLLAPVINESTQTVETVETHVKTPRQFSPSFLRLVDKLIELDWFEEQYPLIKIDVCLAFIFKIMFVFFV
jgi:hypothetical protein